MSMDKEDGFERGFVAGWKARGEHEEALEFEAELAARQAEERDEERKRSEAARWVETHQGITGLSAQTASQTGQQEANQQSSHGQNGQAFCKNCGFPAKTCVCVPQQVNQQSWQGGTEVQQGAVARLNQ